MSGRQFHVGSWLTASVGTAGHSFHCLSLTCMYLSWCPSRLTWVCSQGGCRVPTEPVEIYKHSFLAHIYILFGQVKLYSQYQSQNRRQLRQKTPTEGGHHPCPFMEPTYHDHSTRFPSAHPHPKLHSTVSGENITTFY